MIAVSRPFGRREDATRSDFVALALLFFIASGTARALCSEAPTAPQSGMCALDEVTPVKIARVEDDLAMLTDEGRRIVLAGLDFPYDATARERSRALLSTWVAADRLIFMAPGASAPDRWGRTACGLFFAEDGEEARFVSVAEALLRAGLARFRPDAAAFACRNGLLAAEQQARAQRLGLWASGEYVVLDAARRDAFLDRKGMILVEGVVSGIGEAGGSLYLNFGPRRGMDFAVVIWKRNLETFERAGVRPRMLIGRRVRVRGLIDTRFGPRMEIATPAEIELIDATVAR